MICGFFQLILFFQRKCACRTPPSCLPIVKPDSEKLTQGWVDAALGVCVRVCETERERKRERLPVITCHSGQHYSPQRQPQQLSDTEREVIRQRGACVLEFSAFPLHLRGLFCGAAWLYVWFNMCTYVRRGVSVQTVEFSFTLTERHYLTNIILIPLAAEFKGCHGYPSPSRTAAFFALEPLKQVCFAGGEDKLTFDPPRSQQ